MSESININASELLRMAVEAKSFSYSPYSGFRVGAALVTCNGRIFTGTNIENASFGATCCAERTAVFKAVSEGETDIKAIAIASDLDETIYPCGICRQVLAEFGHEDMHVICGIDNKSFKEYKLSELLPFSFELKKKEVL